MITFGGGFCFYGRLIYNWIKSKGWFGGKTFALKRLLPEAMLAFLKIGAARKTAVNITC